LYVRKSGLHGDLNVRTSGHRAVTPEESTGRN